LGRDSAHWPPHQLKRDLLFLHGYHSALTISNTLSYISSTPDILRFRSPDTGWARVCWRQGIGTTAEIQGNLDLSYKKLFPLPRSQARSSWGGPVVGGNLRQRIVHFRRHNGTAGERLSGHLFPHSRLRQKIFVAPIFSGATKS